MPLIAAALATTLSVSAVCSWNRPGVDPYRGDAAAAVEHYQDIPAAQRQVLRDKLAGGKPDDKVAIGRDAVTGAWQYDPAIRDMHFGKRRMCGSVDRSKWSAARSEPAAVYCADQHCIIVPKICGNVSRITRLTPATPATPARPEGPEQVSNPPEQQEPERHPLDWATGTELGLVDSPEPDDEDEETRLLREFSFQNNAAQWAWTGDDPVEAVPEASTWAMMLAGLGIVGAWGRRASRRTARA
jgi:hypothetical protein